MQSLRTALQCMCLLALVVLFPASIITIAPVRLSSPFTSSASASGLDQIDNEAANIAVDQANVIQATQLPTLTPLPAALQPVPTTQPAFTPEPTPTPYPTSIPPTGFKPSSGPSALDICKDLGIPRCLNRSEINLPSAPPGYTWIQLDGRFSFSAYAHPGENVYMGDLIDIPGIQGLQAKEDFLFGVDGIGMQGGGYILRLNNDRKMTQINIRYIAGDWELEDQRVLISDEWRFMETGAPVDQEDVSNIHLANARFAIDDRPDLIPYYSVAASPRFPDGTKLYVPGLRQYGGIFEVQDRGGAFGPDSQRFDIYVGQDLAKALEFIRIGPARMNLVVFQLVPIA